MSFPVLASPAPTSRLHVEGKFFYAGEAKVYLRGVTYGTFRPDESGAEYRPAAVARDFEQIAASGLNAIRTYTVPPGWVLDVALEHGLRVMVGLPWEQHVAFLDDQARARAIEQRVREGIRACATHPAIFGYAIGNEIPAPIVRWHGARHIERYLERLYLVAKAEDPQALITYVNYPSTEYLQVPALDFAAFNVYLESPERLAAYLARLQNLVGDRPLVLTEIGFDSRRHGQARQASVLDWQVRTAFAAGCAGAFVFAWTDEWHRGGYEVNDWDFGLTERSRRPKPALAAVQRAMLDAPLSPDLTWPRVSVVVCTHNGARTLRDCCEGLRALEYPDLEVIVVDDGSTDASAEIARSYGLRVLSTEHKGLSYARNFGLAAATGDIVAYTDDDARPDPDWLKYVAAEFMHRDVAGVGGPNLAPPNDGFVADCIASAPGGPTHVLVGDREAEHVPGCNMAFRRTVLESIGGFDPRFRAAGDDVDVCWRMANHGLRIGFSPAAVVWHHRRGSVRAYWNQQRGYGRAEALLEEKWPEKYNALGHVSWAGRLYDPSIVQLLARRRSLIYHGVWGRGLFQSVYQPGARLIDSLPSVPELYLLLVVLALLGVLGVLWRPLLLSWLVLALACGLALAQATAGASHALASRPSLRLRSRRHRLAFLGLVSLLFLLQPLARLAGRLEQGLSPWRLRGVRQLAWPRTRTVITWCERWRPIEERVEALERAIRLQGAVVRRGGDFDRWDLEVQGGLLGTVRMLCAVEEHGAGKQLLRVRVSPRPSRLGTTLVAAFGALTAAAALESAWVVSVGLALAGGVLVWRMLRECATGIAVHASERVREEWA